MVFTKLLLGNALAIRPCSYEAALEPLLPKVARCMPVLSSRYTGKCVARVSKRSGTTERWLRAIFKENELESSPSTLHKARICGTG